MHMCMCVIHTHMLMHIHPPSSHPHTHNNNKQQAAPHDALQAPRTSLVKCNHVQLTSQRDGVRPSDVDAALAQPANGKHCCNRQTGWQRWRHCNRDHVKKSHHNAAGLSANLHKHDSGPHKDAHAGDQHDTNKEQAVADEALARITRVEDGPVQRGRVCIGEGGL
jgi:hypothetical protein